MEAEAPLISGALLVALGLLGQYVFPFSHLMAGKVEVMVATLLVALGLLGQYVFSHPMAVRAELSEAEEGKAALGLLDQG